VTHEEKRWLIVVDDEQAISGSRCKFSNAREVLPSEIG
jgi:hypothetical protein